MSTTNFDYSRAARQSSDTHCMRRKLLRGKQKTKSDKHLEIEGLLHGAGRF